MFTNIVCIYAYSDIIHQGKSKNLLLIICMGRRYIQIHLSNSNQAKGGSEKKSNDETHRKSLIQNLWLYRQELGFPDSSVGKEFTCNAGDHGLIPRSGRSTREGIGYSLQYSWVSLVPQLMKNLPAMQETWVQSLGWKDPLEKATATHSSILAWRIPWTIQSMGSQRVRHD